MSQSFIVKTVKKIGFGFVIAAGLFAPSAISAQDLGNLGSSSGIFRSPNPSTAKKNKPAAAPAKTTTVRTPKRKTAVAPKAESAKTNAPKPRPAVEPKNVKALAKTTVDTNKSRTKTTVANTTANKPPQTTKKPEKQVKITPVENVIITVGKSETKSTVDERLEEAIEAGNAARDERDYDAAEKAYRRAQSIRPRDSRSIYGLGNIFSDQQRWDEAEKSYRQAITLEPDSPEAHIALSFVLTQPLAGVNLSERYAEAKQLARRAIELDAGNPVAHDQLGVALELSGQIGSETEQAYRTAIKLDPEFALAYAHLGRLLRRSGLNNESTAAYNDAIRLATDVPTMIHISDVMQSQQRFSESEQLLRRALNADPKNPTALFLLGRALTTSGNFDEAERLLKRSVEVSPNSFIAYTQLGSLYSRRGNYAEAEKVLMKAVKVVSINEKKQLAQEFELIGDGFLRTGRKLDAARVYRQALSLDEEKKDLANKLTQAQKS
jgi:superkiller protein 3